MEDDGAGTDGGNRERPGVCPHVDRNDLRCATRFSLGRIEQAFAVCFGSYHGCPMYHRINRESPAAGLGGPVPVRITVSCHVPRSGSKLPLRATGS